MSDVKEVKVGDNIVATMKKSIATETTFGGLVTAIGLRGTGDRMAIYFTGEDDGYPYWCWVDQVVEVIPRNVRRMIVTWRPEYVMQLANDYQVDVPHADLHKYVELVENATRSGASGTVMVPESLTKEEAEKLCHQIDGTHDAENIENTMSELVYIFD